MSSPALATDQVAVSSGLYHGGTHVELSHGHWVAAIKSLLGDKILALIEQLGPEHPDVNEAIHGRLRGMWSIARYDAPIEYYAAKVAGVPENDNAIHTYSPAIRAQADALLKANHKPQISELEMEFDNLFTTQGVSTLWNQSANGGAANSGAAGPAITAWFNNAQACIGVGDSTTAAANTQFDLQAATNRLWVGMDASFPTLPSTSSNAIVFRSTFGTAQANYAWAEFAISNDNGSNVTIPGSAARSTGAAHGTMLDRVVSNQGTKASGQTWQPSMTLSIS